MHCIILDGQGQVIGEINCKKPTLPPVLINIYNSNKNSAQSRMNSLAHHKNVKQLNTMIDSYQRKLDEKVNQMFNHIINFSHNINEVVLPVIENKKIAIYEARKQYHISMTRKKARTQSIGSRSFVINADTPVNQQATEADLLLKTFKSKAEKEDSMKKSQISNMGPIGARSIGSQIYNKPKVVRKKPEILSKEMRWDPFYDKNAIKAQELGQGMLSLIQRGKVGKNIDIITAFEKGRPILQTHQAIFHHAEQKFTDSDILKSQVQNPSQKTIKKQLTSSMQHSGQQVRRKLMATDDQTIEYNNRGAQNSWALTMPEDQNMRTLEQKQNRTRQFLGQEIMEVHCIKFLHYQLVRDEDYLRVKRLPIFCENWGQICQIVRQIERTLRKYNVDIIYCNGSKILELAKRRQSLTRIKLNDIQQCLIKTGVSKKQKIFKLKAIINKQSKMQQASTLIASALLYTLIRGKYIGILKRKKYQNKIKQWVINGLYIKQYRKELEVAKGDIITKFAQQQRHFKTNFSSIQQRKHYQIHIVNRQYMSRFKYFEEFCATEITRIFNLENSNTNIIYVSPFELNVDTINYYFKIMELQEIENYSERVTFLELEDITSKIKLPPSMNTSQRLYFNSKALRKLRRKIENVPAYFVTNYPSEIDIKLSVHLGVPIYSGDFHKINPVRSALHSERLLFQGIEPTPCLPIEPKQYNVFQLSNVLIRYFESHKKHRKYVLKINNHHFSSGLALLTYPFSSLPEMYGSSVLVQPYYFKSIQKFYSQLCRNGGVVQKYEEGTKSVTVSAKIMHGEEHTVLGTFQRISNGFVNIGYIFPQKCVPHKNLVTKCNQVLQRLASYGHIGYVELTLVVTLDEQILLEQIELYSTKITNSLFYFKFLAGGYLNQFGEFMTKISGQEQNQDQQIASMESRSYCYIPFMLHFGLTEKQTSSFFQLCRIGGLSFDLENKFGTTFIILGSLKDTIGIITTAKDRKSMLKLVSKSAEFLIKQNSHNLSAEMLKEKEDRSKERFNISSIKDRIQQL